MSYLETAEELRQEVEVYLDTYCGEDQVHEAAVKIGHIINLAIRACPRGVQHTVRKNIVATAVKDYCRVSMTECTDERTGRSYHKINIEPRS